MTSPVLSIIRSRIETFIDHCAAGFGAHQAVLMRAGLGEIELEGVEMDGVDDTAPKRGAKATVVIYLTVDEQSCNIGGNMHGGCIAYLVDICSSLPLLALSGHGRWPTSGVSTNINTYYIAAAPLGMKLRIVSTVLQQGKTSSTMQCRVEEAVTGKLLAIGTHVKQDTGGPRLAKL